MMSVTSNVYPHSSESIVKYRCMSTYIPTQLRNSVYKKAGGRWAYCRSFAGLIGVTFEFDHIIPQAASGKTDKENICLSCPTCNRFKGTKYTAIAPLTNTAVPLFHPITQSWLEHFAWDDEGIHVIALSATGRATIETLQINRPVIVQLRRYWVTLNLHPFNETT